LRKRRGLRRAPPRTRTSGFALIRLFARRTWLDASFGAPLPSPLLARAGSAFLHWLGGRKARTRVAPREHFRSSLRAAAKQSSSEPPRWIASSLALLAMTSTIAAARVISLRHCERQRSNPVPRRSAGLLRRWRSSQ